MLSEPQSKLGRTVKCPHCAATLEITPDALAYVCKYCGWVGTTKDVSTKGWVMADPLPSATVQQALTEFLRKKLRRGQTQAQIHEFKGLAVPVWISRVHAHTRYNGYRQETRTESHTVRTSSGRSEVRTKSYPVYIPVKGELDEELTYPVFGRRHAVFFGLEELKGKALTAQTQPFDVKAFLDRKVECIDVELVEGEVKAVAESLAEDEHQARAEKMTSRLFDCYTEDQVLSSTLVFYPVYVVKYSIRGKSFRVTLDGVSGRVLKAELPITLGLRVGYAALGYLGVLLAIFSSPFLEELGEPLVTLIAILFGVGIAALSFHQATEEQRIERG